MKKATIQRLPLQSIFIAVLLIMNISLITGCRKSDVTPPRSTGNEGLDAILNMQVPADFNFETTRNVNLDISILAPDDSPIKYIPVNILDMPAERGGKILFTALTNANGKITGSINLPLYYNNLVVDPHYIGVMRNAVVTIVSGELTATLGGRSSYAGNVVPNSSLSARPLGNINSNRPMSAFTYMGSYDSQGKPNYLAPVNDVIGSQVLSYINTSLPEGRPVTTYHPDYLLNNVETNINIAATSNVWITFVSEGAGYKNSIAYFKYPTSNPPQSTAAIDTVHIIFPNASLNGSGGSMQSGNRVNLGTFTAGTSIGFILIADGWNGSSVRTGNTSLYTIDRLNPESQQSLKRHSVLLYNDENNTFLIGMEDIRRDASGCDNDFNDCVFYVKSEVVNAISTDNVNPIDKPADTDGDGVTDVYDKFPNDASRAYINYYPSANTFGTLAFEDNWPYRGDYDFNDMVVGYRYTLINDNLNRTVEMSCDFVLRGAWAAYHDGFGVEFPFLSSNVQAVTGSHVTGTQVVTLGSNGCEAGQTKAVIFPFDDALALMPSPLQVPDTVKMKMIFNTPVSAANISTASFNPFIIVNQERGREIHIAGYAPTQKATAQLFRTGDDNTNASQSRYYKTNANLPWGLSFAENFNFPAEGKAIGTAYTNFINWAQSAGVNAPDWYTDSNHMVPANIFRR